MSFTTIKFRRGSAAAWAASNPILMPGEPGYETDTRIYKVGDGNSAWADLPRYMDERAVEARIREILGNVDEEPVTNLQQHVTDPTPHPAYDDLPSLTLLFENGLT